MRLVLPAPLAADHTDLLPGPDIEGDALDQVTPATATDSLDLRTRNTRPCEEIDWVPSRSGQARARIFTASDPQSRQRGGA